MSRAALKFATDSTLSHANISWLTLQRIRWVPLEPCIFRLLFKKTVPCSFG